MDETDDIPEGLEGPSLNLTDRLRRLAPTAFPLAAVLVAVIAFCSGSYLSLGREGVQELLRAGIEQEEEVVRPRYEWIDLDKTIYQLDRREDAKYVLAQFTIRVPVERSEEVRNRLPELEFALQTYIRELSSRELQGAMGLYNLRNACLFRARRILGRDAVTDIVIGELLVE